MEKYILTLESDNNKIKKFNTLLDCINYAKMNKKYKTYNIFSQSQNIFIIGHRKSNCHIDWMNLDYYK
jgi:hypothetical protein